MACFYVAAAPTHQAIVDILGRTADGNLKKIAVCLIALGLGAVVPSMQDVLKQGETLRTDGPPFDF